MRHRRPHPKSHSRLPNRHRTRPIRRPKNRHGETHPRIVTQQRAHPKTHYSITTTYRSLISPFKKRNVKKRNGSGVPKLNKLSIKLMPGTRFCSDSEPRNRFLCPSNGYEVNANLRAIFKIRSDSSGSLTALARLTAPIQIAVMAMARSRAERVFDFGIEDFLNVV